MEAPAERVDVLIAGAGPTGLFLAGELRRRGVSCAIVERNAGPSTHSKALALMPRTLEILEMSGLLPRFESAINRIDRMRFVAPHAATSVVFAGLPTRFAYVSILPQWKTEALLEERLREFGGEVRYGCALESFEQDEYGVRVTVGSDRGTRTYLARFLVGCDGARSTVRTQAGIAFEGRSYDEVTLLADVPVRTPIPRNESRIHVAGGSALTLFPMNGELRRVVVIAPRETLPEAPTRDWLQRRIERAGVRDTLLGDPVWTSTFRVHRRAAAAMRSRRVFLAGDAAHIHSPVGGQGMNLGLHDAWNLAWKLDYVAKGSAPDTLLDTYEAERLPVAREVLRRTGALTHLLASPNPLVRTGRELLAPYVVRLPRVRERTMERFSQLSVPYARRMPDVRLRGGAGLYAQFGTTHAIVAQLRGFPRLDLRGVAYYEAPLEDDDERIVLVRPDGYIAYETRVTDLDEAVENAMAYMEARGIRVTA